MPEVVAWVLHADGVAQHRVDGDVCQSRSSSIGYILEEFRQIFTAGQCFEPNRNCSRFRAVGDRFAAQTLPIPIPEGGFGRRRARCQDHRNSQK
jgi:hypothetical protein